jgi:hypothetical protein
MRAQRKASAWRSHQSSEGHGGCSGDVLPVWSVLACHRADPRRDVPALLDRRPDDAAPPAPAQHADQPGLRPGHPERPAERKPSIGGRGHGPVLPTHRHLPARNPGPPLTKCRPRGHGWLRRALARQAASAVPRTAPSAETAFLRFPVRRLNRSSTVPPGSITAPSCPSTPAPGPGRCSRSRTTRSRHSGAGQQPDH